MDQVAFMPLGGYLGATALRADLRDRVVGIPVLRNIRRALGKRSILQTVHRTRECGTCG
jgi:hypothetical protein